MLPLLSMTSPMLTGTSSRLNTASFCSTLSSRTRKLSCFNPSANRPRSSSTVVCNTTRLTSTLMLCPCPLLAVCPGGAGCAFGIGICANDASPNAHTSIAAKNAKRNCRGECFVKRCVAKKLVARRVVSRLGIHTKRRQPLRRAPFNLNLPPARSVCFVAWPLSDDILVSQLHADFCRDVRKLVEFLDREDSPASHLRNFPKERRTVQFFRCAIAISERVKNADGIELGVRFFYQPLDIVLTISTMIIASVRQNEQGALGVTCTPHLTKTQINSVQQRGAALWHRQHHPALQIFDAVGKRTS